MSDDNPENTISSNEAEEWFIKGYNTVNVHDKIISYRKAIELASDNPGLWEILGHTYLESENYEEALRSLFEVSGERASHPDYLCLLGDVYSHLNKIDEASRCYEKAREMDSLNKRAWTKTGNLLDETGNFIEARDCFQRARKLPEDPGNYLDSLYVQIIKWFDTRQDESLDLKILQVKKDIKNQISPLPESVQNRYENFEYISKGGFGEIYKATRADGNNVAIKIPTAFDSQAAKAFILELNNWNKLSHPNIVRLLHYEIKPHPFFEMELCDSSLADMKMPIEVREAAWIIFHICEGLKYAHAQKIIHRDLKPHNILIKNGMPKISDWGLSRVLSESRTVTNISFSTPYAAPEQIDNRSKDERTDIWQVGVVFYELVTGKRPFEGDSQTGIMAAITAAEPKPPGRLVQLPSEVESIILKCLEKKPENRYQSVLDLQKVIASHLKFNYTEELRNSISIGNNRQAAYLCGELVLVHLRIGEGHEAFKYLKDLLFYTKDDFNDDIQSLIDYLQFMIEDGIEISDDIIIKINDVIHKVRVV